MARGSLNRRPRSMAGWGMVTPSNIARGVVDTIPGELITYTLDWPELARLRGDELDVARDTAEKLYPLFHAGRGETPADRKALATEVGLVSKTTVDYHRAKWDEAGRPAYLGAPVAPPAPPPELPAGSGEPQILPGAQGPDDHSGSGHQVDLADPAAVAAAQAAAAALNVQTTPDGAVLLLGPGDGTPSVIDAGAGGQGIEGQAKQGAQGAAFDAGTTGAKIEQAAGVGPATVIRCQEEGCAHFRIADEQPGCAAPAMPPGQALGFKNNNWPETVDCPHVEPVLVGEQVVSGTGHILGAGDTRGNQVDHDGPGDLSAGQDAQPAKRDLDAMIAEALPARRRGNHQHPLPPPQPVAPKPEEKIPERGQICEAQVARVEVDYVLVDLIEFYMPDSKRWIRGRIRARELLRRGPIPDCTRTGLLSGDMLNVQVLDVQEPEHSGGRLRVELSSRLAPPHPKERHGVLEQGGPQYEQSRDHGRRQLVEPRAAAAPVVARGAQVAAELDAASGADAAVTEARRQAQSLVDRYRLAPCHMAEYAERIQREGAAEVEEQLKADLATLAELKASAAVVPVKTVRVEFHDRAASSEQLEQAAARIASLQAELKEARENALQLGSEMCHAQTERDQARRAVADLVAQRDRALAAVVGLCETCVFRSSGFCPYPETIADEVQVPDEDLNPNHKGRVIKFGRRPVVECELFKAEARHA